MIDFDREVIVVSDTVVIDEDNTDRPLIDALLQQGVPRGQIVRLYAGEPWVEPEVQEAQAGVS